MQDQGTERRAYGRIRLDELASGELRGLLEAEQRRQSRMRELGTPEKFLAMHPKRLARVIAEIDRMREELGWE